MRGRILSIDGDGRRLTIAQWGNAVKIDITNDDRHDDGVTSFAVNGDDAAAVAAFVNACVSDTEGNA